MFDIVDMVDKKSKPITLTEQQKLFCAYYVKDLNGPKAARAAKYSEKNAHSISCRLLSKVHIREEIERLMKRPLQKAAVTVDRVIKELARVGFADLSKAYEEDGSLKNIHEMDKSIVATISGIEVDEITAGKGSNKRSLGKTKKVKMHDKVKALELLGRHLKMFTDNVDLTSKGKEITFIQAVADLEKAVETTETPTTDANDIEEST